MTMRWILPLALCMSACAAQAVQAAAPASAPQAAAPAIRVHVAGQQPVVAGQAVQVQVTILAPNFFLSAPVFPTLQVPGAVITMPDERGANATETIGGVSYAGITKTYVLTPQTGGEFALPTPTIRFTYAGDDGKPREGSVVLPATTVRAAGQTAAASAPAAARSTLPAVRLFVQQQFDRPVTGKDATLHAGDAVVRTVTIFAPGAQAMMIEPPPVSAPRGVRVFRAEPVLSDAASGTGDAPAGSTGGRRVENITYVFERSGRYTLPAISVPWYDASTGRQLHADAPAVTVEVGRAASGLGLAPAGGAPLRWPDWIDGRLALGCLGVLAVLALAAWAWTRRTGRVGRPLRPARRSCPHDGSWLPPLNP
ncbi:BatD family protein [Cupriavidus pauculus]|uniref:BatD family protein n=1 Tax=Cupriavidus pauculus TaxID=82633 RepID=UPI001FD14330|nr:BatD family protein [Cupriavidus pauculus]